MIKTTTDETRFQHNPRRELYDSRDNIDIYREVFAGIKKPYQAIGLSMILNVLTIMISRKRLLLVIKID